MKPRVPRWVLCVIALAVTRLAQATHIPPNNEPIQYDGSLTPGVPSSGSIGWSSPKDGYDWFCFKVTSGKTITITATRTSGDIKLNLGLLQGVANNGDPRSVLPQLVATSNSTNPDVSLTYTPGFTGPITLWVSTWLNENGGNYDVTMTGGDGGQACGIDQPPNCDAGANIAAACDGVTLNATASDPDNDPLTFAWTSTCAATTFSPSATVLNPTVTFGSNCKVNCTLTLSVDDGRGGTCTDTVPANIDDIVAPTLTKGSTAACYPSQAQAEVAALAATTVADNCPGPVAKTASTTGTCAATITVTAKDGCGNSASVSYATRIDSTPPVLIKGSIAACYPSVAAAEAAVLAATTITDDCPGAIATSVATLGACAATVTVTAKDGCGNSASVSYAIRIDSTPPVLTKGSIAGCYPSAVTAEAAALAATTVADDCPGPITKTAATAGDCAAAITVTATDGCGNVAKVSYSTRIDGTPPDIQALLVPAAALPARSAQSPRSLCSAASSRAFRVVCAASDNCDAAPATTQVLRVTNHDVAGKGGPCALRVEDVAVSCGEIVEIRLLAPPCPALPPRSPRVAVTVTSAGIKVVSGEKVVLVVSAKDGCGNAATVEYDPSRAPSPLCDEVLKDGTCCPAIARPPDPECKVPLCAP